MSKPLAVLISDIHFNLKNLGLSTSALLQAINKANLLNVPLIVAGDLHDTKANLRGECVTAIINCYKQLKVVSHTLVGNHDKINEKSYDHSLEFLRPWTNIVDTPVQIDNLHLIPYSSELDYIQHTLKESSSLLFVMHQGLTSANMGDYIQDPTALSPDDVKDLRIISGHYHKAQDIGNFSYLGSPFTMTFGEANDGKKGYAILHEDGTLKRIPLDLRRHVIINRTAETAFDKVTESTGKDDLVWFKVTGPRSELQKLSKAKIAQHTGYTNFKLDLIPTDNSALLSSTSNLTEAEVLDRLIEGLSESDDYKVKLKTLWRTIHDS